MGPATLEALMVQASPLGMMFSGHPSFAHTVIYLFYYFIFFYHILDPLHGHAIEATLELSSVWLL